MTFDEWMVVLDKLPNLLGTTFGIAAFVYARLGAKRSKEQLKRSEGTQDWQNAVLGRVARLEATIVSRGRGRYRNPTGNLPTLKEMTDDHADPW